MADAINGNPARHGSQTAAMAALCQALAVVPGHLAGRTHRELADACEAIGLPTPPSQEQGNKFERASASFDAAEDVSLPAVAANTLTYLALTFRERNVIQDALWALTTPAPIPSRTRREIARALDIDELVHSPDRFTKLLEDLWVERGPWNDFLDTSHGLIAEFRQHVYRNPDWSTEELFEQLGAYEATDARFGRFLEGLASARVVPDVDKQRAFVTTVNPHLSQHGLELRETGDDGGYPEFTVVSTRTHHGRPKNLIFASSTKPDLRFSDAIDNNIEIASNADSVLIYDRPIGRDGLRWRDLQTWWQTSRNIDDNAEAKHTLYKRLLDSLPANSPPQRNLFHQYHTLFGTQIPDLPALLPEVWLHWDPKTVQARGRDALLSFRMDFLLLLPHGRRAVLEVDGKHHYATGDLADTAKYAKTMRADRELRLSNYEVFRFGAHELLTEDRARTTVQEFFPNLFQF
ncbi:AbiJ-related protein [Kutzneria chonburiensis]|uniref:AbiJ-NTD3 domain-containing protein n=1 Tax=Kutzneria chonburiensis TaxID=1483604 RepID=A0ABV6MP15_9PSEU|nr:hypothetical protein [Kutzneria chonburiensis]